MVTSMVLLQLKAPGVIHASRSVPVLEEILDILDTYNKLAPGLDRDDKEDLAWPGVWSKWRGHVKWEGSCTVNAGVFSFSGMLFHWEVKNVAFCLNFHYGFVLWAVFMCIQTIWLYFSWFKSLFFFLINVPILQVSRNFNNQHFKYLCYLSAYRLHFGKVHPQT